MLAPLERRNSFKANVSEREEIVMSGAAEQFDYIVVGAGSAGAAVANRLSADSKIRVLVLEAGGTGHFWSRIPIGTQSSSTIRWQIGATHRSPTRVRAIVEYRCRGASYWRI